MKQLRSSRQLVKIWRRREMATIRQAARAVGTPASTATQHSPFTADGLSVEDQVRKVWRSAGFGLATF